MGVDVDDVVRRVEEALERRFGDAFVPQERCRFAAAARDRLAGASVKNYLPILVERLAVQMAQDALADGTDIAR